MRILSKINPTGFVVNKKIFALTCLIAAIVISSVCGAVAYYSDSAAAKNDFTVGQVTVTVNEEFDPPEGIEPGIPFTKKPTVQNTGDMECYVRIKIVFSDESVKPFTTLDLNTDDWVYNNIDDCYYYTQKLGLNESTEAPFTQVTLSTVDVPAFDLFVYAEAVEARDFTNYTDAWEYFND